MYNVIIFVNIFFVLYWSQLVRAGNKHIHSSKLEVTKIQQKTITKNEILKKSQKPLPPMVSAKLRKELVKGIGKTLKFLQHTAKTLPKKSPMRFRIIQKMLKLSIERASFVGNQEYKKFQKRWNKWDKKGRKGQEPKPEYPKSTAFWHKVLKLAGHTIKEFPKNKEGYKILYDKALAYQNLNKQKKAASMFLSLVKKYPKSPITGEVYFSLGEYYFNLNEFGTALKAYRHSLKYHSGKRYGWALYKAGWCYYNLSKYKKSLHIWKKTILFSSESKGKSTGLHDEVIRDMVFVYAELKQVDPAITFFKRFANKKQLATMLNTLGQLYFSQANYHNALKCFRKMIKIAPYSSIAFNAQTRIVEIMHRQNNLSQLWKQLHVLQVNFSKHSKWAKRNKDTRKDDEQKIEKLSIYYPQLVNQSAQKSNIIKDYKQAIVGYELYLKVYPKSKRIAQVEQYIGDIEYILKKYSRSGAWYMKIVKGGKNKAVIYDSKGKAKSNIFNTEVINMLNSYSKAFQPVFKKLVKIKPNFSKPTPLSRTAKNFISSCALYLKVFPKDKKTQKNCDTFISETYYRSGHKKQSLKYLWLIATRYSNLKEGSLAVENLIPLLKDNKKEQIKIAKKLVTMSAYSTGKLGKKLKNLIRSYTLANIAKEKNVFKQAQEYEEYARSHPNDVEIDILWFNAANGFLKAKKLGLAMSAYKTIVKNYPKSKAFKQSAITVAQVSDKKFDFNSAVKYYMYYVRKYPNDKKTPAAWQRSCQIKIIQNSTDMLTFCSTFARKYPSVGVSLIEDIIFLSWKQNSSQMLTNVVYNHYLGKFKLSNNQQVIALHKIYKVYNEKGNFAQTAKNNIVQLAKRGNLTHTALQYYGEFSYQKIAKVFVNIDNIKLVGGTVVALQASIKKNILYISRLEKASQVVFATKDSYYGIACFYNLARAYAKLANLMANPPGIKGAPIAAVRKQLAPSAKQMATKADQYFKTGISTAKKFSVYNDWVIKLFNGYNNLKKLKVSYSEIIIIPDLVESKLPAGIIKKISPVHKIVSAHKSVPKKMR